MAPGQIHKGKDIWIYKQHFHIVILITSHNANATHTSSHRSWVSFPSRPQRRHQQATTLYSLQQPQSCDHSLPLAWGGGTNELPRGPHTVQQQSHWQSAQLEKITPTTWEQRQDADEVCEYQIKWTFLIRILL